MPDITNLRIGVCSVKFKGEQIGHTKDGVEFEFERTFEDLRVDQYTAAIDKALVGQKITVKVALAEITTYKLNIALPEGGYVSGDSDDRVNLGQDTGYRLRDDAGELVLHPIINADNDLSEDITLYKAVSVETVSLGYKIDEQRILEITFEALVDETEGPTRRLGHIGPALIS